MPMPRSSKPPAVPPPKAIPAPPTDDPKPKQRISSAWVEERRSLAEPRAGAASGVQAVPESLDALLDGATPSDTKSSDTKPSDTSPTDAAPGDAAPTDAAPGDAAPGDEDLGDGPTSDILPSGRASSEGVPATTGDVPMPSRPSAAGVLAWDDDEESPETIGDEPSKEEQDPYVGTVISDRYVVDELIGEGGMGKVYLAHHKVIGKRVALKVLHLELAKDKEAVGRFVREAKAASSIGNPHIIDISDFGEAPDGATYFAMEYLEGGTLGDVMEDRGALDLELVCNVAIQLCDGLAAAHRQQIVHRDLKPDNITLDKQEDGIFCKILDFGIAKVSTSASSTKLTMAGAVFGTPHYMSPEQAAGDAVDHRTDIYSLGVMIYEMIAGVLPFNADNFMGILTQHMYKAPLPISEREDTPDCPRGLEAIVLKCLSKKPEGRYQTMEEMQADVMRFVEGEVPEAVHDMMNRTGGFNVPAEYFKTGQHAAIVPAGRRLGPRLVAIVGVLVAVGVVLFVLIKDATSVAQPPTDAQTKSAPSPEHETTANPTSTASEADKLEVLLHAKPAGAVAIVRGVEVPLPTLVPVTQGKPLDVLVKADGYQEQLVPIDGSIRKVAIELEPVAGSGGVPRPLPYRRRRKPKPKPVHGVVDPWGK
jgi:eukaryotic-like serine/threonine-protein kinase